MLKNKIFQYFFVEFFKLFLLISLSFSLLIWFTQAARLLELVTEYGNPIGVYAKFIIFSYPRIFEDTFLLNFIVSMFFLFAKLNNSKEIGIYWLSGVSKLRIYYLCQIIGVICIIFYITLANFLSPWSSYQGRLALANSKFSLINSLVKEKNFNSPLKNLTVHVEENDKRGNLKGIFIYEKNRTITAQYGRVLSDGDNTYLELNQGTTQEINNNQIKFINFTKTIFDFSKYQLKNTSYPKFKEREMSWLLKNLKGSEYSSERKNEIREEINSRILTPFLIIIITTLICFNLFSNNEKINQKKLKLFIYVSSIIILILNQVALGVSGKSFYHSIAYLLTILTLFFFLNFTLIKSLNNESK